jgi:hypothetical protein
MKIQFSLANFFHALTEKEDKPHNIELETTTMNTKGQNPEWTEIRPLHSEKATKSASQCVAHALFDISCPSLKILPANWRASRPTHFARHWAEALFFFHLELDRACPERTTFPHNRTVLMNEHLCESTRWTMNFPNRPLSGNQFQDQQLRVIAGRVE